MIHGTPHGFRAGKGSPSIVFKSIPLAAEWSQASGVHPLAASANLDPTSHASAVSIFLCLFLSVSFAHWKRVLSELPRRVAIHGETILSILSATTTTTTRRYRNTTTSERDFKKREKKRNGRPASIERAALRGRGIVPHRARSYRRIRATSRQHEKGTFLMPTVGHLCRARDHRFDSFTWSLPLKTKIKQLASILDTVAAQPTTEILDGLRDLERKTALVFTLLKTSVYSIVLQQELDWGDQAQQ